MFYTLQRVSSEHLAPEEGDLGLDVWLPGWWSQQDKWSRVDEQTHPEPSVVPEFHGQDREDEYALKNFFRGKNTGTYLEMGALDGVRYSNTMYYQQVGWKGVLIEPNTAMYSLLKQNRPLDVCINLAVCDHPQPVHFIGGAELGGIWEFMSEPYKQQWYSNVTPEDILNTPIVTCQPLHSVLRKLDVQHIDFFSLDVEGAELEVLQTFPFDFTSLGVVVIEAQGRDPGKDDAVRKIMTDHGLTLHAHVERNDWFVNSSIVAAI